MGTTHTEPTVGPIVTPTVGPIATPTVGPIMTPTVGPTVGPIATPVYLQNLATEYYWPREGANHVTCPTTHINVTMPKGCERRKRISADVVETATTTTDSTVHYITHWPKIGLNNVACPEAHHDVVLPAGCEAKKVAITDEEYKKRQARHHHKATTTSIDTSGTGTNIGEIATPMTGEHETVGKIRTPHTGEHKTVGEIKTVGKINVLLI